MREINSLFDKLGKKIYKYGYENGKKVVETDGGKYIIKHKTNDKSVVFNYLLNRGFSNFIDIENEYDDPYEIYRYQNDVDLQSEKGVDLVYLLSILHNKTTTYQEVVLDKVKEVYEKFNSDLEYLNVYYHQIQDYIESKVYMAPDLYLLIRNVSLVDELIGMSKNFIDSWYEKKINQKKERVVFLHNNLSLDNFVDGEKMLFKDWDKSCKDWVVYDFYKFYRNNYRDLEFDSLYEIYQSKYRFTEDEKLLFLALICKVWKIELKKNNYDNCILVNDLVVYVKKTKAFVLKYNKEYEKTNQEEFSK